MSDDARSRSSLSPEDWAEMRRAYEAGESEASLSRRFKVDRKTIRARRRRESWVPQVAPSMGASEAEAIRTRATAQVIDIATKRAVETAQQSGTIDTIADEMLATSTASKLAAEFMIEFLKKAKNGSLKPGEADDGKSAMAAYRTFSTTLRDHAGRKPGQSSVPTGTDETKRFDEVVLIVRERAPAPPPPEPEQQTA